VIQNAPETTSLLLLVFKRELVSQNKYILFLNLAATAPNLVAPVNAEKCKLVALAIIR
jgi:hypothetical protein